MMRILPILMLYNSKKKDMDTIMDMVMVTTVMDKVMIMATIIHIKKMM